MNKKLGEHKKIKYVISYSEQYKVRMLLLVIWELKKKKLVPTPFIFLVTNFYIFFTYIM